MPRVIRQRIDHASVEHPSKKTRRRPRGRDLRSVGRPTSFSLSLLVAMLSLESTLAFHTTPSRTTTVCTLLHQREHERILYGCNHNNGLGPRIKLAAPRINGRTTAIASKADKSENENDGDDGEEEKDNRNRLENLLLNDNNMEERILFVDEHEYDEEDDSEYLKNELERLESMEKMLKDIEEYCSIDGMCEDDEYGDNDDDDENGYPELEETDQDLMYMGDLDELESMESLFDFLEETEEKDLFLNPEKPLDTTNSSEASESSETTLFSPLGLEEALLQGVVPVDAGVGSNTLPGDFGFDPLEFSNKDYVKEFQYRFLNWLPGGNPNNDPPPEPRPTALILRDYREAEIRHGRLAMLAVIIWPIQEKLDNFLLGPDRSGPLLYGPVTLPYLPLFMTLVMMLLGYLDIYTKDIQEEEGVGDAFLPGDCFWDPLRILDGAPATMKKNMQERELFNGRVAMLAFAAFVFEEATSHQAIVNIPSNEVLFVPAYQIPVVQEWLDAQFLTYDTY